MEGLFLRLAILFNFGDEDGDASNVLLQHCVALTEDHGNIYIADTYNGKVKVLIQKQCCFHFSFRPQRVE